MFVSIDMAGSEVLLTPFYSKNVTLSGNAETISCFAPKIEDEVNSFVKSFE